VRTVPAGTLLGLIPAVLGAQGASLASVVQRRTLENGLQVIVVEDHTSPLAAVVVAVRGGAFVQDSGRDGLAHLFEHLLFSGYHGDPARFGEEAAWIEGGYNGGTAEEYNEYVLGVPADKTAKAIGLLGDLMRHITITDRAVAAERPIVLNELQRDLATPEEALSRDVDRALWGGAWPWKDVGGDSTSLARLGAAALQRAFGQYYVPNNMALIVTGDVSAAQVFESARRELGGWPAAPAPLAGRDTLIAPAPDQSNILVRADAVQDVTVIVRVVGPAARTDTSGTYAAEALIDVLDDPTSAFQRLLVTQGPFESVDASFDVAAHGGAITFRGTLPSERAEEGIQGLLGELDDVNLLRDVTDADLATARRRGAVEEAMALDGGRGLAERLAYWWGTAGLDYLLARRARRDALTVSDLVRVANRYVIQRPRSVGILAPPGTADTLLTWLRKAFQH